MRKVIRLLHLIAAIVLMDVCVAASQAPAKVELKENAQSDFDQGRTVISVADPVLERGQDFKVDVRFVASEDGGGTFFNVFLFNRGAAMPARLALFNAQKVYVGNLLQWAGLGRRRVTSDDWYFIPAGAFVGTTVTPQGGLLNVRHLPVGTYYLQMVYNKNFIAPRPERGAALNFGPSETGELFRSNIVTIELVDKKPEK